MEINCSAEPSRLLTQHKGTQIATNPLLLLLDGEKWAAAPCQAARAGLVNQEAVSPRPASHQARDLRGCWPLSRVSPWASRTPSNPRPSSQPVPRWPDPLATGPGHLRLEQWAPHTLRLHRSRGRKGLHAQGRWEEPLKEAPRLTSSSAERNHRRPPWQAVSLQLCARSLKRRSRGSR